MLYIIDLPIQTTKIYYRRNMVMNVLIAMLEELQKKITLRIKSASYKVSSELR